MTKTEQFFKENATNPTAWNQKGYYIRFSIQKMIYDRDETEIKKLVNKYKLNVEKISGHVVFTVK